MKTRISTNDQKNSFELVVIKKGRMTIKYFNNLKDALDCQKFILDLEKQKV